MRYIKIILSALVVMLIATIAIWSGIFILLLSVITAPILAWWISRKAKFTEVKFKETTSETSNKADYKVIEAEYEIIEK